MDTKDIIILDTNFIVENKNNFSDLYNTLSATYEVYIPEVAINERIGQRWRELKKKYNEIERIKIEYNDIIRSIYLKSSFEDRTEKDKKASIEAYKSIAGDHIIPMPNETDLFKNVLDRSYKKVAPFNSDDNASDKGFKDTLLWLSILEFFKNKKTDASISFITNDNIFFKYKNEMAEEFLTATKNNIQILENSFYKKINQPIESAENIATSGSKELTTSEKQELRDNLSITLNNFCSMEDEDYYGNIYIKKTFKLKNAVNNDQVRELCENLLKVIKDNAFSVYISPSIVFGNSFEITQCIDIPMKIVENLNDIYINVCKLYPDYKTALINEICNVINKNVDNSAFLQDLPDDDLPF